MNSRQATVQKAYRKKNVEMTKKAHTKKAIQHAHYHPDEQQSSGKYIGDAVYGAIDGMVTTFAVVSGVVGAELSTSIILVLGFANLFADGFSMAAGNYLSKKSEKDYHREEYNREKWEVENYPKGEIEEIREIYKAKGFSGADLEKAVNIITSDKERWVNTMMLEELGIVPDDKSPLKAAAITFISFVLWGFLPLLTFVLLYFFPSLNKQAFLISCIVTAMAIFVAGSLRSLIIAKTWFRAGLEMLTIGGAAASVAYIVGYLLRGIA